MKTSHLGLILTAVLSISTICSLPRPAMGAESAQNGANCPGLPYSQADFYVGTTPYQMYVQNLKPSVQLHQFPIVFVHGGAFDGSYWLATPDGREGWAPYLASQGWNVYVVDWPGQGRSFHIPDTTFCTVSLDETVNDLVQLLQDIGPSVLLTHSIGGCIGWKVTDTVHSLVKAIVAIAPAAPANLLPVLPVSSPLYIPETSPYYYTLAEFEYYWTSTPLFPQQAVQSFYNFVEPVSARAINEKNNILGEGLYVSGPQALAGIPLIVIIGNDDPRHSVASDKPIADYFNGQFVYLPDVGMPGHGHFMAVEYGNLQVADLWLGWLGSKGF